MLSCELMKDNRPVCQPLEPIAVAAVVRPPWLAAVVDELGVRESSVAESLQRFAAIGPPETDQSEAASS